MANITKQRTGELLKRVIELLWDKPEGMKARDILAFIGANANLSEYELGSFNSSPQAPRYERIIQFATIDLVKAGWLNKSKGFWYVTDAGKEAHEKYKDAEAFFREAQRLYHQWEKTTTPIEDIEKLEEKQEEELDVAFTFEQAEANAWEQINNHFKSVGPYDFQEFVAHLLRAMGYHVLGLPLQAKMEALISSPTLTH